MTHIVQFYEDEGSLYSFVGHFVGEGLRAGDRVLIVATEEHRTGLLGSLRDQGLELDRAADQLLMLDAQQMLSTIMQDGAPDVDRFDKNIGAAVQAGLRGGDRRLRVYGEMVALLCQDQNRDGARSLEQLWNELGRKYEFSLLCSYPSRHFFGEETRDAFDAICHEHDEIHPSLHADWKRRRELETAYRDAVVERERRERDLKDLEENAPIGMHWVGPDGTILWANDAELELLGYAREQYIGRNIAEFHADQAVLSDILGRLGRNEEIHDYEASLIARDGSIRHVAIDSNVLFEDGRFVHTRCFTRDITPRKRLEEANAFLLDASAVLNRSLDYATHLREIVALCVPRIADACSIDMLDADGGVEHAAAEPQSFRADTAVQQVLSTQEPLLTKTMMCVPLQNGGGTCGVLTLSVADRSYDATDFHVAEELGRRAGIALENARLYQLAQSANRTKDEFLATLSHELRTPLTAILGWSRMMLLGGFDAETTRTALETIERSARTQAAIIDDLLDLSKIVTGKLALNTELVDLSTVIDNAIHTVRLAADARNITLDRIGVSIRTVVFGDPTRLQQIVWNLLSNAIKFSEPGGHVTLRLDCDRGRARITVSDRGRGIPKSFLPHVFEAFRQADAASTRAHGGLGLGLAIVKYLVELHGGTVHASSAGEGQGATFTVTIPLASRRSDAKPLSKSDDVVDLTGMSILLVDDDADTREVVTAILRRCGARVDAAASVNGAFLLLQSAVPDVLVTDIAMPGEDGFSLLQRVQSSSDPARDVRVVALTAMAHSHAEQQLRSAGFHAWVQKPVDPVRFARVIAGLRRAAAM